jgi:5-formyltetrahydrofolate cyclo-ligase
MREWRRSLSPEFRSCAGVEIIQKLAALDCYRAARTIHTYVAWQEEVENHELLRAMLQEGKRIITPKINSPAHLLENYLVTRFEALAPGAFGILEPSVERGALPFEDLSAIDLVIVPGLAFDRQGNRLGYGGGYYDRLLEKIRAPKAAPAFAAQILDAVPAEAHDQRVDFIVTEEEVIACRQA